MSFFCQDFACDREGLTTIGVEVSGSRVRELQIATSCFGPFSEASRGDKHNQVDCELWMERVVEEERRLEKVEFAGSMDVVPLEIDEEVAVVAEKKFVVRLPVAVAESVTGAEVAEDVAMVEVVRKGKEVAVGAEEAEEGVGSREEDWTLVKMKVQKSGMEKRRRLLEEERDAVRKRMNVWRPAKVEVPNALLGQRSMRARNLLIGESVEEGLSR
ncbi:hypothetical protein HOY80DRAFT_1066208 [Tuber brumale]|nr:hypothetical protein HOY80DRAFT_1066208 [Tuber brumale]